MKSIKSANTSFSISKKRIDESLNKLSVYLFNSSLWIFLTAIMFVSLNLLMDSKEVDSYTWFNYFRIIGSISFLFLPTLIYGQFRKNLLQKYKSVNIVIIWLIIFIVYPFLVWKLNLLAYFLQVDWKGLFIPVVAGALLLSELGILSNNFLIQKIPSLEWFKKINLEKAIIISLVPFAIFAVFMTNGVQEELAKSTPLVQTFKFLSYALQYYIILFIYYLFYVINHYILINQLFKKKGLIYYGFGFTATIAFLYPVASQIIYFLPIVHEFNVHPTYDGNIFNTVNSGIPALVMLASIPFILSYQWLKQNNEITTLEKEKSETELTLLKQQINPHFFFNTLNNLYALSLTKDQKTPEVILQLSDLMRYVIYKGKEKEVKLSEEIKYIEDYIELQKIRLHKKMDFRFEKNIEDDQINVPPLLFIILIENAFKHGIEPAENDCYLHMKLESDSNTLRFSCKNSMEERSSHTRGIGLENLRRRLDLRFPDQHQLTIKEMVGESFEVELSINF